MLDCEDWNCGEEGSFAATLFDDVFFLGDEVFLIEEPVSPADHVDLKVDEGVEGLHMAVSKVKRRPRSRKSNIMVKLYQPANKLSGLPYKGRARKTSDKLYVFPVFDQSSSLSNLPLAIITHINSGNRDALSKLLYSHFDPACKINLSIVSEESINIKSFFKFNSAMSDLNPDLFMCVHATKLEGNRIRASIYNKATANRLIHDVIAPTITDSFLQPMVGKNRSDFVKSAIATETKLTHESADVEVNDTEQDLIVYMRLEMELLVDATTKLITHWRVDHQVTSIVPVDTLSKHS